MALRTGLFTLEPLARLLEAMLLCLLCSFLPGTLDVLVVCSALGHGRLLLVVAAPRFSHGGDHDPFFIWFQALSWPSACWPPSVTASGKDPEKSDYVLWQPDGAEQTRLGIR